MTLEELDARLVEEGYGPLIYERGPWGLAILDFRIQRNGGSFTVCWSERGEVLETWLATSDEAEACAFFLAEAGSLSWHLATSQDEPWIGRLGVALETAGIPVRRNDIPNFNGPGDARYRIFVNGRDLRRGREIATATL